MSSTYSGRTLVIQTDITQDSAIDELFTKAEEKFQHLDFVVNNAGVMDRFDPAGELDRKMWDRVIAINLTAPYCGTHPPV